MRRARFGLVVAAAALAGSAIGLARPVVAAAAGWSRPHAVQPGGDPLLSFSPTGAAAIGSQLDVRGRSPRTEIDVAAHGTDFSRTPSVLGPARQGQALASLALSSRGAVALAFTNASRPAPALVRVSPASQSGFAPAQQLIATGRASAEQASPDALDLLATSTGEIVGAGSDDAGDLFTASLAPGATSFRVSRGPGALGSTDDDALAADAAGDSFLAGDGSDGCSTVAFRPPRGSFRQTYRTGNCSSGTPNVFDAITAGGRGQAALLSEDLSESGTGVSRLFAQVGRDGHFGSAVQLGGALGGPVGLASDADGEVTASWTGCDPGPVVDGQQSETDCAIDAATGSLSTGFSAAAAAGDTLESASAGSLSALTADRGVAVSACRARACSFSVYTAAPTGGFRPGHLLGRGRRLIALSGDDHGDLLAVWASASEAIEAATGSASTGRWSAPHRLTGPGISPAAVSAEYGPAGTALVAWSVRGEVDVAAFSR